MASAKREKINCDGVEDRVSHYIQGKYGIIGIILPEKKTTEEEWNEYYRSMAEIMIRAVGRNKPKEASDS